MVIISSYHWICHTIDIKAAYLQGRPISRDIYIRPPKEFNTGFLWKLKKVVYGLCDAARAWYLRVREVLITAGMVVSRFDQATFFWYSGSKLAGVVCIHVDDFCWAGTEAFEGGIIHELKEKFLVGACHASNFKYLGYEFSQTETGMRLDQYHYVDHSRGDTIVKAII